jgi:hypothetical protein
LSKHRDPARKLPCGSCAYWEPYPTGEGVGTCENTASGNYLRMAMEIGEQCGSFVDASNGLGRLGPRVTWTPLEQNRGPSGTTCIFCHYWLPFESIPYVGQCDNPSSRLFEKPAFSDKPTEECFVTRDLGGLEFMWCQSHHQTIHSAELPDHASCRLFVSSVSLPVEDEMELTFAGD